MPKKRNPSKGVVPDGMTYEDDGDRYVVLTLDGQPVYTGNPVIKGRGEELVRNLLHPAQLVKVEDESS